MLSLRTLRPWPWHRHTLTDAGIGYLALSTSILSGSTFSAFGKTLSSALTPLSLVFISEVLVLLFLLLSFGLLPVFQSFVRLPRPHLVKLLMMGCLSGIAGPTLWFTGLSLTTAVNANFFGKSELVFVLLIAGIFLGERITRSHMLATSIVFVGLCLIALRGLSDVLIPQAGDLLIVLGALSYASSNSIYRKYLHDVPAHIALCSRSLTAVVAFFIITPFLPYSLYTEAASFPITLLPALVGFGFISRYINSVAFYEAVERLPMSTISLVGTLDVILSTVVAYAMLGEPIAWYHILGGSFIILGMILLELLRASPSKHAEEHMQLRQRVP